MPAALAILAVVFTATTIVAAPRIHPGAPWRGGCPRWGDPLWSEDMSDGMPGPASSAGVLDLAPTVVAVTGGFGHLWKVRMEGDLRDYVEANRPHLASILLFELAHEGQSIPEMEPAAELGGLQAALKCRAERLAGAAERARNQRVEGRRSVAAQPDRSAKWRIYDEPN